MPVSVIRREDHKDCQCDPEMHPTTKMGNQWYPGPLIPAAATEMARCRSFPASKGQTELWSAMDYHFLTLGSGFP